MSATRIAAAIFDRPGQPMAIERVQLDAPREGEALIQLAATGICGSDQHVLNGDWPCPTPIVLGHESAGTVLATGPGTTSISIGDHVVLSWMPACGRCSFCAGGRENLCSVAGDTAGNHVMRDGTTRLSRNGRDVFSFLGVGGFAESVVVPEAAAVKIPPGIPFEIAAIVGCGVTSGIGATQNTVQPEPDSDILVIGCGGVGLSAIMGASLTRPRHLIAVSRSEFKLALARRFGATDVIIAGDIDLPTAVRAIVPSGVHYAFDAVGVPSTIEESIACLRPGGTTVLVGQSRKGDVARIDPLQLSDREFVLKGSSYGSGDPSDSVQRILGLYAEGKLPLELLIDARVELPEVNEAAAAMAAGKSVRTIVTF